MPKLTAAIGTLLLIVITGALLAAACGGGGDAAPELLDPLSPDNLDDFLKNPSAYCDPSEPACEALIDDALRRVQSTPVPLDPQVEEIFRSDAAIQAIVGDGVRNQEYWVRFKPFGEVGHGDGPGEVVGLELILAEPVSLTSQVVEASDPCKGQGEEGYIDPAHSCLTQEREFTKTDRTFTNARFFLGQIYLRQGQVANLTPSSLDPDGYRRLIDQIDPGRGSLP